MVVACQSYTVDIAIILTHVILAVVVDTLDWLLALALQVTLLFSDIVGFTEISSEWRTELVVTMLDMMFSRFDELCAK